MRMRENFDKGILYPTGIVNLFETIFLRAKREKGGWHSWSPDDDDGAGYRPCVSVDIDLPRNR